MQLKGAIFDLDGTLLDSMFIWNSVGIDYLRSLGIEPPDDIYETFKPMSLYQAACFYQSEFHVDLSTDEIMNGINAMVEDLYYHEVQPKADVVSFLELLSQHGVKMCVATLLDEYLVRASLERIGILKYFSEIFTATKVGKGKDEPDIYEAALAHLGTQKENTLVFEDSFLSIQTAKKAGFSVAAIYDRFEENMQGVKSLADFYFETYSELQLF